MTSEHDQQRIDTELRRLAEEIVQKKEASSREDNEILSPEELKGIFHELRVHQIELEMQNVQLRETQVALETSQARYFDLYDLAPVGYCTVSREGLILEANLKAATLLGAARNKLVGQSLSPRFIHKEDRGEYYLLHNRLFETGESQGCDLRMVKTDDTIFWVRLSTSLAEDQDGPPLSRIVLTDITERKRTEEALRISEERFRVAQELSPDGFTVLRPVRDEQKHIVDFEWVYANQAIAKMGGIDPAIVVGRRLSEVIPGHAATQFHEIYKKSAESGKPGVLEAPYYGETMEEEKWFRVTVVPSGKDIAILCQDITEQKCTEKALVVSEERLQQALLVSRSYTFEWTPATDRIVRSASCANILNLTGDEACNDTGQRFLQMVHPDDRAQFVQILGELTPAGNAYTIDYRLVRSDGTIVVLEEIGQATFDAAGKMERVVGVTTDITERKRAEEQLQGLTEELEQRVEERTRELQESQTQILHAEKLSAIGRLSASIAHEFNNPLQGIMTILKGFQKTLVLEEQDRVFLDLAFSESERMKNLIRSLQDFNRPSSGKKVFMDVHATIDSLILLCKSDFKRKGVSMAVNYAKGLPQIFAIADQIKQVLLNLLQNAADSCDRSNGLITISTSHAGKMIAVAIEDNGVGIPPDRLTQIFQPFYTTKSDIKGIGLGLSICHGIVQNHQGEIRVESELGKGSTFTVLLPIVAEST